MKLIKLGAACLNQTPLDWDGNHNNIINVIDDAYEQGVNVLVLPELCVTGYGCEDAFFMPETLDRAWNNVNEVAEHVKSIVNGEEDLKKVLFFVAIGAPVVFNGGIYNCTVFINQLGIQGICPKKNLASDGIHYEPRWFKKWDSHESTEIEWWFEGRHFKTEFGHVIFRGPVTIGAEICEDAWVSDRPGIELSKAGVDVIVNPSASHFAFGKDKIRQRFIEEGSRAFRSVYVYSNLLGNESGRVIFDGDTYIAAGGKIISRGIRFSYKNYELTTAVVDMDKVSAYKYQDGSFGPSDLYKTRTRDFKGSICSNTCETEPSSMDSAMTHYTEFTEAVSLGLWDYMRKSWSKGFVLSLSGGADSAAVACLVRSMILNAVTELGQQAVVNQLNKLGIDVHFYGDESTVDFSKRITGNLLHCVYQTSENSSDETKLAALLLAESMGAKFSCIDIQGMVDDYIEAAEHMVERKLSWEQDDIALQNIQARVRSPSVWMLANIKNALLLSTSNRSEAAVGYATMDGDTSGGLAPIAGASKTFILEWLEVYRYDPVYPFDGLDKMLELKPTAELRPQDQNQTDEDDLMPYPILNMIELMVVRDKMSPRDVYLTLKGRDIPNALDYTIKFFKLFTRNQWKRERYAPSFHVDDESLDPKTFFRFPILNSGFRKELVELESEQMEKVLK